MFNRIYVLFIICMFVSCEILGQVSQQNILATAKLKMMAEIMNENHSIIPYEAIEQSLQSNQSFLVINSNLDTSLLICYKFKDCVFKYVDVYPHSFVFGISGSNIYRLYGWNESDIVDLLKQIYIKGLFNLEKGMTFEKFCNNVNDYILIDKINLKLLYKAEKKRQKCIR